MARHKRRYVTQRSGTPQVKFQTRRQIVYRKRLITRKPKTRKIEIVSRRGQPRVRAEVKRIKKAEIGGYVSSSWIAIIEWRDDHAYMMTLDDYEYNIYIPFDVFEAWYYAHSKGTFFNSTIKDKYPVVRA